MTATTFNGDAILLIDDEPDWSSGIQAGFEVVAMTEAGLTNRETRRALGASLRVVLRFQIIAQGTAATRLAREMRAYQAQPVAIPFWPAAVPWSERETTPITSGIQVAFKPDWSQWELYDDTVPSWPEPTDLVAPVVLGRISPEAPTWLNPGVARFAVDFEEQSAAAYAIQVAAVDWTPGSSPSSAWDDAPPGMLPATLCWESPTMGSRVDVGRDQLGFGRQPVETLYAQANYRKGDAPFVEASAADVAKLLRFFLDHAAGKAYWSPAWAGAATLTAPLTDGGTVLALVADHDLQDGDWLHFATGGAALTGRVDSVTTTSATLASAPGPLPLQTVVSHLLLCRFERPRISVEWMAPGIAKLRLAVRELPAEYTPAAGETLGGTLGSLPTRVWLYELREPTENDGATIHRYTSFERDLDIQGESYASAKIDHGAIRQGIALDRDDVEVRIEVPGDANHPLVRLATLRTEAPITMTIRRADVLLT